MDQFVGIEVGAEVELNDGTLAAEDHTSIKLENKRDLPLWQNIHHFDDSSSDESLDEQYVDSTPSEFKTPETPSLVTDLKSQSVENEYMEKNIYVLSTTENIQPGLFYINGEQREDNANAMSNADSKNLEEQPCQLVPYFTEPVFSHTEVISDFGQLQPYSKEVYLETTSTYEEGPKMNLAPKYSSSETRAQYNRPFNPVGKSFKCQRCGRQFGRLYNLEHHICIEKSVVSPPESSNNIDTMSRLEKMCAEAQKELQTLQGQYKKDFVSAQSSLLEMGSQELISGSGAFSAGFPSDHNECESRNASSQEFQISSVDNSKSFASQSLAAFGNTVVVDLPNSSPTLAEGNQEKDSARQTEGIIHPPLDQTNGEFTNQRFTLQSSEENPVDSYCKTIQIYKCKECGKIYKSRLPFINHLQLHKKNMTSSSLYSSSEGHESLGTTYTVRVPITGLKKASSGKPTQTFICEFCGKPFNRRCSYSTHIYWHMKRNDPVTITPAEEAKPTALVSVVPIKKQNSEGLCTRAVETFTCQYCGRVFDRHCAYVNHCRWHAKEQELLKGVKAGAQRDLLAEEHTEAGDPKSTLDHNNLASYVEADRASSDACPDDDNVQGYCKLVRQLSLDEQCSLSSLKQGTKQSEEPSSLPPKQAGTKQPIMPEVLESVLELVVGTEEVHEILLSKAGVVFRKAEDYENDEDLDEEHAQVPEIKLEPEDNLVPKMQSEHAEEQIPVMKSELEEEAIPGTQLEFALNQIAETQLEPAEEHVSVMQVSLLPLRPTEKQVSGAQMEPAEKWIPGMHLEPAEKRILRMHLEQSEKWKTGLHLEPAGKTYSLQILPSKLAAKHLSRPKPPHRCRDCGIRFHQFWRLKRHRLKGYGKKCTLKKHRCDCSRTPIGSLHFLLHQLQHLSDTAFICEVCSKTLHGYRQLQAHSWVHPLVSQFQCKCGTRFKKLPRYLWHSLKNKAKPKTKLEMRSSAGAPL